MNTFSGTMSFLGEIDTSKIQEKHLVITSEETTNTTLFVFGKTEIEDSDDLVKYFWELWEVICSDFSISTEDNMAILNTDFDKDWVYEVASFESAEINFRDIAQRFQDSFEAICVREAEESEKFGNRIIKVDFIY